MGLSWNKIKKVGKRAVTTLTGIDAYNSLSGKNAAERATAAQVGAANQGIATQRTAQEQAQALMQPYLDAGTPALQGLQPYATAGAPALQQQQAAIGLQGPEAQQAYIDQLEQSPYMQAMMEQGENALLQNASATGGLRGGNTQQALMEMRPELMQKYMDQQYSRLGGISQAGMQPQGNIAQMGQASAAGQASGALQTGANIAGLQGQIGASVAGGQRDLMAGRMGLINMGLSGAKTAMGMF